MKIVSTRHEHIWHRSKWSRFSLRYSELPVVGSADTTHDTVYTPLTLSHSQTRSQCRCRSYVIKTLPQINTSTIRELSGACGLCVCFSRPAADGEVTRPMWCHLTNINSISDSDWANMATQWVSCGYTNTPPPARLCHFVLPITILWLCMDNKYEKILRISSELRETLHSTWNMEVNYMTIHQLC